MNIDLRQLLHLRRAESSEAGTAKKLPQELHAILTDFTLHTLYVTEKTSITPP